ncbi:hypothetical protein MYP_490 [Sporocytophaga myxococcoides]|uniref:Glycosyltransferase n=1 Tax=Sporocytophaga myxococcoides TaxID=153721 RepID=A0A098LA37_9BACT|nr:hypothetical protein [Sporocytophaga myxococcoides]GAL83264.1 hypothetical protein MYP_490 [Sporocytophaga myxococcoides]
MPNNYKKEKWVTIVNRHYPPNPGITGESAWDLSKYLIEKYNIQVQIIHVLRNDDGGGAVRRPIGKTISVPTLYKGKNESLKSLAGFLDGLFLIIKTLFVKKGPVICMTSPPLLPFWASIFFGLFRIRWYFWSMDLFPEAFVANGKINNNSLLYRIIKSITYRNKPELLISLGPKQAEHILENYKTNPPTTILPCGVFTDYEKDTRIPEWKENDGKIYFGYCGNLGAPHSHEFLKIFIDSFNPDIQHLVLAVYGPKANDILEYAKGKPGITLLKNVPRSQLHYIDIHLVSLLPQFNHIAVPSKAISSICTGGTVLFYGNEEADTWFMLQNASWLIDINKSLKNQLDTFTKNISREQVENKKKQSAVLADQLHTMEISSYEVIADYIIRYYQK